MNLGMNGDRLEILEHVPRWRTISQMLLLRQDGFFYLN